MDSVKGIGYGKVLYIYIHRGNKICNIEYKFGMVEMLHAGYFDMV